MSATIEDQRIKEIWQLGRDNAEIGATLESAISILRSETSTDQEKEIEIGRIDEYRGLVLDFANRVKDHPQRGLSQIAGDYLTERLADLEDAIKPYL